VEAPSLNLGPTPIVFDRDYDIGDDPRRPSHVSPAAWMIQGYHGTGQIRTPCRKQVARRIKIGPCIPRQPRPYRTATIPAGPIDPGRQGAAGIRFCWRDNKRSPKFREGLLPRATLQHPVALCLRHEYDAGDAPDRHVRDPGGGRVAGGSKASKARLTSARPEPGLIRPQFLPAGCFSTAKPSGLPLRRQRPASTTARQEDNQGQMDAGNICCDTQLFLPPRRPRSNHRTGARAELRQRTKTGVRSVRLVALADLTRAGFHQRRHFRTVMSPAADGHETWAENGPAFSAIWPSVSGWTFLKNKCDEEWNGPTVARIITSRVSAPKLALETERKTASQMQRWIVIPECQVSSRQTATHRRPSPPSGGRGKNLGSCFPRPPAWRGRGSGVRGKRQMAQDF